MSESNQPISNVTKLSNQLAQYALYCSAVEAVLAKANEDIRSAKLFHEQEAKKYE